MCALKKKIRTEWVLAVVGFVLCFKNTWDQGPDFQVYWKALHAWWTAEGSLYDVQRDGLMSFKYPPWIAPVFLPFAMLPLGLAKALWGMVQGASLAYLVIWASRRLRPLALALLFAAFLPLFVVHSFNGQVALPMLVAVLVPMRGWVLWALSSKIFSVFPWGLYAWTTRNTKDVVKALAVTAAAAAALTAVIVVREPGGFAGMMERWHQTATSGKDPSSPTGGISVSGREAQGWLSLLYRNVLPSSVDPFDSKVLTLLWLFLAGASAVWLIRLTRSKVWTAQERWWVWLSWTPTLQPLAGFYSFVWAWPLAVLVLAQAKGRMRLWAWVCIVAVIGLTQKSLPAPLGTWLESISIKAWGVAGLVFLLARLKNTRL